MNCAVRTHSDVTSRPSIHSSALAGLTGDGIRGEARVDGRAARVDRRPASGAKSAMPGPILDAENGLRRPALERWRRLSKTPDRARRQRSSRRAESCSCRHKCRAIAAPSPDPRRPSRCRRSPNRRRTVQRHVNMSPGAQRQVCVAIDARDLDDRRLALGGFVRRDGWQEFRAPRSSRRCSER